MAAVVASFKKPGNICEKRVKKQSCKKAKGKNKDRRVLQDKTVSPKALEIKRIGNPDVVTPVLTDEEIVQESNQHRCHTAPVSRPDSFKSLDSRSYHGYTHNPSRGNSATSIESAKLTVCRSGRKSRPASVPTLGEELTHRRGNRSHRGHPGLDNESDNEDGTTSTMRGNGDFMDFGGADIYNESGWDTDLEAEEEGESFDHTGRAVYFECCKTHSVIPASYFIRHMNDSTLDMKHHGLGPQGIKPLAVALVSNTRVLNLNLTDNWLGLEGGNAVCDMLLENCYITDLDLSDNRLGAPFAQRLVDVLTTNTTITHITLAGNDLDDHAAVFLAQAISNTTKLEELCLSRNQFGEASGAILGPAIAENSSIRHLDLSWNWLRRKGAVAIAQGLKQNVLLQKINLSWNGLGWEGAKALGDALKVNSSLEDLDIANNRITTEGAVLLGKGLALNETLKVLKMGKNPMQSAGCFAICASLMKNPNSLMKTLDFSDIMINDDFTDMFNKLKEQLPEVALRHGGDGVPPRPKMRVHPMIKLKNYIDKHNLKLVDFFNKFDKDQSMSVSREEFVQGLDETGIKLTDEEVTFLLDELDKDGDGEINYSEMAMGHQDFTDKERVMAHSIMAIKAKRN